MHRLIPAFLIVLLALTVPAAAEEPEETSEEPGLWIQIVKLYQEAKDSGETASEDVYEWARTDLESIGDWEYKVKYFPNANHIALEKNLNELGIDRWEVIWIDRQGPNLIVTMKRPSRTWLNKLPLGQLIKMVAPVADGGGE